MRDELLLALQILNHQPELFSFSGIGVTLVVGDIGGEPLKRSETFVDVAELGDDVGAFLHHALEAPA